MTTTQPARIRPKASRNPFRNISLVGVFDTISIVLFAYIYALPFYIGFSVIRAYVIGHGYEPNEATLYALFVESIVAVFGVVGLRNILVKENVWPARVAAICGAIISVVINTAEAQSAASWFLHALPPIAAYTVFEFALHQVQSMIERRAKTNDDSDLINRLSRQVSDLTSRVESAETERDDARQQVSDLQANATIAQATIETLQSVVDSPQPATSHVESPASDRAELETEHQSIVDGLQQQVSNLQAIIQSLTAERDKWTSDRAELETEHQSIVDGLQSRMDDLQATADRLRDDAKRWQAMQDRMNDETMQTMLVFINEQTVDDAVANGLQRRNIKNRVRSWNGKA